MSYPETGNITISYNLLCKLRADAKKHNIVLRELVEAIIENYNKDIEISSVKKTPTGIDNLFLMNNHYNQMKLKLKKRYKITKIELEYLRTYMKDRNITFEEICEIYQEYKIDKKNMTPATIPKKILAQADEESIDELRHILLKNASF
jgi:NMD protein affecting ribosome stability and mRNA decay